MLLAYFLFVAELRLEMVLSPVAPAFTEYIYSGFDVALVSSR